MPAPPPAAATTAASNVRVPDDVFYPCSDGKPMAENMWQADAIMHATGDLRAALPTALVAADILMYPDEGNNKNPIAPDVLVGLGLGPRNRSSYFVWKEGKPPDWVLEVASPSTQADDLGVKRCRYAEIGVPEYWMFDPKGGVYPPGTPRLQGLKLADGKYIPLPWQLADGGRMIHSEVLGFGRVRGRRAAPLPRRGDRQGRPASVRCRGGCRTGPGNCRTRGSPIQAGGRRSARPPKPRRNAKRHARTGRRPMPGKKRPAPGKKRPAPSGKRPARSGRRPPARPPRPALRSWRPRCGVRECAIRREWSLTHDLSARSPPSRSLMTAMLRRLTLQRFRSLRSATVAFDNPTFLVGQNGAGKSNIVDALSLLADAMALPLSAVLDKRGGIGAVGHRSASRGRVADMGLRVEIEGLVGVREAMYAFEVRATQGYGYKVRCEQCRCVAEDGTRSWFHRAPKFFRSNTKTHPALAPNALALPLVAGDKRFAPLAQFLSDIQPYRIDPRTLREMQDPDAGVRLRSDGGNAASVLRQLNPGARRHLQEFLQTVVSK